MPAAESWRLEEFRCAEKVRRDDQSAVRFIRVLYREPIIQIGEAEKPEEEEEDEEEEARKRIRARARASQGSSNLDARFMPSSRRRGETTSAKRQKPRTIRRTE